MTKRERTVAAFHGKEVDHVPVCMWKHVPREYWDEDDFVKYQVEAYKNTDVDFMKLSGDKYFGWPSPLLDNLTDVKDLYKLEPLGENHPYIRGQVRRTGRIMDALKGECPCLYLVFVPFSCIRLRIGYPAIMKFVREDPEALKYAMNVIAEDLKLLVKGLINTAGCDGIFYSVQNGEIDRFTPEEYASWLKPAELDVLACANNLSDMNAMHFCAWENVPNRLSLWDDYKAPVISWSRYMDIMDINEAKRRFGCTVWGGFDNRPGSFLYTASKEEIEKATADLIAQGGKTGYILGSDCSMHGSLADERIRWVAEASRKI